MRNYDENWIFFQFLDSSFVALQFGRTTLSYIHLFCFHVIVCNRKNKMNTGTVGPLLSLHSHPDISMVSVTQR
jgi:hypothetical protein